MIFSAGLNPTEYNYKQLLAYQTKINELMRSDMCYVREDIEFFDPSIIRITCIVLIVVIALCIMLNINKNVSKKKSVGAKKPNRRRKKPGKKPN